jgi:formate dehydrogenase major subunit
MTNHWVDIKNADLILIMGGNAAEAHPCGFKWVIEAMQNRKAKLVVVDPRFTRSAAVGDYYAPIRVGSDIAFLGGVIHYLIGNDKIHHDYVKNYTNASFLVREDYAFENGIFSGYNADKRSYDKTTWDYQKGPDGYALVDETLQNPRCVFQLMKQHFARYTPETVTQVCGTPKDAFLKVCEIIASTSTADKVMTIMYALGWTQHSTGSEMIRTMAMIQLLLGNIGRPGGGVNALRGHANVQGSTDFNLITNTLPGYMGLAGDSEQDFSVYLEKRSPKPLRPNQISYSQNFPKFYVSLMKAFFGNAATADNNYCYDWMPKVDKPYDVLHMFERMYQGQMNGFFCQGFNPLAAVCNFKKVSTAFSKLKFLVVIDPLRTETSEFWMNAGQYNNVDSSQIQTEVFRLPSNCFAEDTGSFTNSGRVAHWHYAGAPPPGDAKTDAAIMAGVFLKLRELYQKEGGAFPDPILNLTWAYANPVSPSPEEIAMEFSGKALKDVTDPQDPTKVLAKAGQQLAGFAQLRDDGSTACGNWLYCGHWSEAGNLMARRELSDPSGLGFYLNWGIAWPANRRILYNVASTDASGKPWDATRTAVSWNGTRWVGNDVPDMVATTPPGQGIGPFIMNAEGVARLFSVGGMNDGPFPEHYEPFETPIGVNPLNPGNDKALSNPAARVYKGDLEQFGKADEFPYAATTYRLTEHFHFWTKHGRSTAITQPEQFVEIGTELAEAKGIKNGDWVRVRSNRGELKAKVVVTKRVKSLDVNGQRVHTVGIPIHWGFTGLTRQGYLANELTTYVGDATTQTPEFKSFLVDIEKA